MLVDSLKTTARTIIHAPIQYTGFSLHHIYDLQGHEKLKFVLLHTRRFDYTGKIYVYVFTMDATLDRH